LMTWVRLTALLTPLERRHDRRDAGARELVVDGASRRAVTAPSCRSTDRYWEIDDCDMRKECWISLTGLSPSATRQRTMRRDLLPMARSSGTACFALRLGQR
jgi:hypothetical protein